MSNAKIALTAPQTIPLDKLSIHKSNVRQIKAGVSIESLAADIARRGLLQSLSVRPILDSELVYPLRLQRRAKTQLSRNRTQAPQSSCRRARP
jgi:hypothetical protein